MEIQELTQEEINSIKGGYWFYDNGWVWVDEFDLPYTLKENK